MKVGLYFGSFNPIHSGHLIIANHLLNETEIDKLWFVVSPHNPLKAENSLLNEHDRLHLVKKATENDERIFASDVEFSLPKPSFTSHTLAFLTEKQPKTQFSIIMGSDSFQNIRNWKNFEYILKNFEIFIYNRPGFEVKNIENTRISIQNAPLLDISATFIRNLIKTGKSIRYLVPEPVREEIEKSNYYKK